MILLRDPRLAGARWANTAGTETAVSTTASTPKWWQNSDMWNAIGQSFSGLTDMFGSIFSGAGNKQTDSVADAGAAYIVPSQSQQQKSNMTWLWIVGAVALVAVAFIVFRKFKK